MAGQNPNDLAVPGYDDDEPAAWSWIPPEWNADPTAGLPEGGGAEPAIPRNVTPYTNDTPIADPSVVDVVLGAARDAQRAGLPENVRNGSYDDTDMAALANPNQPKTASDMRLQILNALPNDPAAIAAGSAMDDAVMGRSYYPTKHDVGPGSLAGGRGQLLAGTIAHIAQATGPTGTINQIGTWNPGAAPPWQQGDERAQPILPPPPDEPAAPILPPLQVDAISGLEQQPAALTQSDDVRSPLDPYTGVNSPDAGEQADAWVKLAAENPAEYIKQQGLADQKQRDMQLAEEARIAKEDREQAERDNAASLEAMKRAQQAHAQLESDVTELANQKVDPDRWWNDRSTGQKVAGYIAAIVGGLAQSAGGTGGRNVGLDMINKAIDDDIAAQTANLQNRRGALQVRQGLVADMFQQTGDLARAQATARIASREQAIRDLEIKMQQYDPQGTTARRIAQTIVQAKAASATEKQKYAAEEAKRQLEIIKAAQEQQKIAETAKNNRAEIGLGYSRIAQDERESKRTAELAQKTIDADLAKTAKTQADAQEKEMRELGVAAPASASLDANGNLVLQKSTGLLKQADGTPWKIPTTDEAKEFRKKKAAADNLVAIQDEIRQIRDRVGGESSWGNSDDYQRLQVLKNNLVLIKKSGTQGMSSDEDMNKLIASLGAKDPTSFRSQAAGLDEGREQIVKQLNTDARNIGYTGDAFEYPDPVKAPKAVKTPEQSEVEDIEKFDRTRSLDIGDISRELNLDVSRLSLSQKIDAEQRALSEIGGVLPSIKARIDKLKDTAARDPDPKKREFANESLDGIARNALDPNIRAYVTSNAFDVGASAKTTPEEEPR
jgi:hypothetical protein